jgi:hypothetical protein
MSEPCKVATDKLVDALEKRPQHFESVALDALEENADPNVVVELRGIQFEGKPVRLPALAVASVIGITSVARGLLQFGASPAYAHEALVEVVTATQSNGFVNRRLTAGLRGLGAILNHRIIDLERYGRSLGPFDEPYRPGPADGPPMAAFWRHISSHND